MNNEEAKVVQDESLDESVQNEKKSTGKIGGLFKGAGKFLSDVGNKVVKWTKEEADRIMSSMEFKKEFIKETYEFKIEGTNESFRAFKNPTEDVIFFRVEDEKITKYVKSNSILVRTTDGLKLSVISVETKKVENGNLKVNGTEVPISLFTIFTKPHEKEKITTVVNNVTQSMTITGSTIQGNIQQISDLANQLNDFETQLKAYKAGLFNKNIHTEAVKIYGDVKSSIINGQKDSPIVLKFLELLRNLGGSLLSIFTTFIK